VISSSSSRSSDDKPKKTNNNRKKKRGSDSSDDESDSDRVKRSKKIGSIKRGITENELSKYTLPQLIQWCKDHRLASTGKKESIINRILTYFSEESLSSSSSSDYTRKKPIASKKR